MFIPKYTITNNLLKNISLIEVAKEFINENLLNPQLESKLKSEQLNKAIFYGVTIEGSPLTEEEVKDFLSGRQVNKDSRDLQEVVNYSQGYLYINQLAGQVKSSQLNYGLDQEIISNLHRLITKEIMLPEFSGEFRIKQIALRNSQTGEISYTPPPSAEVPYLVEDLINFINSEEALDIHPILRAGLFHSEFLRIHPFLDGNNKLVRLLTNYLLSIDNYDFKGFVFLEEYFAQEPYLYFQTLQNIFNQRALDAHERDLTRFLEYFVEGLLLEVSKVKEVVKSLSGKSKVKTEVGEEHELNEREMLIVDYLHRYGSMQNKDFRKIFPEYSDDTVLREIKFLKEKGIVKKVGGTKKARYVLS